MKTVKKKQKNREIERYKEISKIFLKAQKEVIIFVKKNTIHDPRLRISSE